MVAGEKYATNRHLLSLNGGTSLFTFQQHHNADKQRSMKAAKRIINQIINEQALED